MKKQGFFILTLSILIFSGCLNSRQNKHKSETFLGQKKPGLTPELFSPNLISSEKTREFSCTLSADGKEFYFARETAKDHFKIFKSNFKDNRWSEPEIADFSGDYFSHEPYISRDGNKIHWGSVRPSPNGETTYGIWVADKTKSGWGIPYPLDFFAMYVTESKNKTLYYTAQGYGGVCIAKREFRNNLYQEQEIIEPPILSQYYDAHPCISSDESFLIFDSENHPDANKCALFISFKNDEGRWGNPINMHPVLKRNGNMAMLSPDEKFLFFSSDGDIYWVDAQVIDKLK